MSIVRRFGEYVEGLAAQPVTVPVSSVVDDMLESYARVTEGRLNDFYWSGVDQRKYLHDFIATREVYFTPVGAELVLEAAFSVLKYRVLELDVQVDFAWNPSFVQFEGFSNVAFEVRVFVRSCGRRVS